MMQKLEPLLLILMAISLGLNGLFMLWDPIGWYEAVPGVTRTGPPNAHFIRDIGLIYVMVAGLLGLAVARPAQRRFLTGIAALWISGHGLFHVWEWLAGVCTFDQFMTDAPGVILPAVILTILALLPTQRTQTHV